MRSAPPRVTDSDCQSDMMLQMAVFTEAFSHVHIQKPSLQILSLFLFRLTFFFIHFQEIVHSDSQESFTFRPTNVLQAALNLHWFMSLQQFCGQPPALPTVKQMSVMCSQAKWQRSTWTTSTTQTHHTFHLSSFSDTVA